MMFLFSFGGIWTRSRGGYSKSTSHVLFNDLMICNECVVVAIAPELEKCWTVSCGCIIHWCIFVKGTFGTMSMSVWCIGNIQISLAGWFPTNLIHAKIFPAVQTKEYMIETTMYEYHDSVNKPNLVILGIACLKEGYLQYQAKKKNKK